MTREELFTSIAAARPGRDEFVYLQRRGDIYDWRIVGPDASQEIADTTAATAGDPDVWMSFSAAWPAEPARLRAFFNDVLAELESMADTADRCRWPLDEPWPHFH
ncbi:MAG TPA: hypothetical protein VMU34_02040 [Mycobacterium sp.]|nr:hypothetical protein [Mycobacterium sp.]